MIEGNLEARRSMDLKAKVAIPRTRNERPGGPSKGGGGGKFTYGRPGDELLPERVDVNDLNYDNGFDISLVSEESLLAYSSSHSESFNPRVSKAHLSGDSGISLPEFKVYFDYPQSTDAMEKIFQVHPFIICI